MNEAELLFTHTFNCDRTSLYLDRESLLDREKAQAIAGVLERRAKGEPIQYILGKAEFMGLEFKVESGVLIPRPETEVLVETTIRMVASQASQVTSLKVLDIGTGSGCIAVSLAKLLNNVTIIATDISQQAIEVAKCNALLNNVSEKIRFVRSDLFATCDLRLNTYDLIVSNPPYIPTAEIDNLQPEIKYEPRIALDGGRDGLEIYRRIIEEAPCYLKSGGALIMEIGCGQARAAKKIAQNSEKFKIIEVVKDYSQIERVIAFINKES